MNVIIIFQFFSQEAFLLIFSVCCKLRLCWIQAVDSSWAVNFRFDIDDFCCVGVTLADVCWCGA